jgi:FK506-binding nuclear protein
LSGNYVTPLPTGSDSEDSDDEDGIYDLSPDEDELDELVDEDSEEDELDDLDERITEIM